MEFAIAQGFGLGPLADRVGELAFSTVDIAGHRVRAGTVEVVSTRPAVTAPDGSVRLFAGYASYDGEFVHPLLEPSDASVERVVDAVLAGREPDGGLFAAVRVDASGVGCVEVDPLGQYPLYSLRRGRDFVVSNNPHFVDAAVRSRGPGLTRSVVPAIDNIVYGGPLGGATMFEEVSWLLVGQSLRFDEDGLDVVDRYPEMVDASSQVSVDELVAECVGAMRRHVVSVAEAAPDAVAVADVTGGHDTRTVLALVTSTEAFPDLTGRCITRYPNPDANVAGLLMEHLDLQPGPFPILPQESVRVAQEKAICQAAHRYGGARDPLVQLPFSMDDLVHLTGEFGGGLGAGGNLSALVGGSDAPVTERFANGVAAFLERRSRSGATALLTAEALDVHRGRLRAEMEHLDAVGVPDGQVGGEVYLRSRCKSHCALSSVSRNACMIRPDIHANASLARVRRGLEPDETRAKRAMLEIILRTTPELAFLPMIQPWPREVVPPRWRRFWEPTEPVTAETRNLSRFDGPLWKLLPVHLDRQETDDAWLAASRTERAPRRSRFAQAPAVVGNQALLRRVLESTRSDHDLWTLFDRTAVERAVALDPYDFERPVEVGALGRTATAMAWLLGLGVHEHVRVRLSMRGLLDEQGATAGSGSAVGGGES